MRIRPYLPLLIALALVAGWAPVSRAAYLNGVHSPDGVDVIAVGDSGMIYRSVDAGTTYNKTYQGTTSLRAVTSRGFEILIVGDAGLILRSTDDGGTWTSQTASGSPRLLDVEMSANDTAYAVGASGTVLRTVDGGVSWSGQSSGTANTINKVRFLDGQHGWIVGDNGFAARTSNGGATWTPAGPATANHLYAVDQNGSRIWVTGVSGTCWHSIDDGVSWTALNLRIDSRAEVRSVVLQGADSVFIAGGGGFLRRSIDDGATWTFLQHRLLGEISDMEFVGARSFVASGRSPAILRSLDGGDSWSFPASTTISSSWVRRQILHTGSQRGSTMALNPVNRSTIYAVVGDSMYLSRNDGDNWTGFSKLPAGYTKANAFLVSPKDSNLMVMAISPPNVLARSTDGGASWAVKLTHFFGEYGIPLEIHPDRPDTILFGGDNDSLYRSTDFGNTWTKWGKQFFRSPCDLAIMPESDSSVVLVGDGITGTGNGELWRSVDGGQFFTKQFVSTSGAEVPGLSTSRLRNHTAFMTHWGAGGVDRSLDSGLQWGQVTTTLSAWGTDIARDDPNVVVFGVYSGLLMYVSFDGGTTFTTSSIGGSNYGVYTRDRNCMLAEQGDGLYKMYTSYSFTPTGTQSVQVLSPNGGETWEAGTVQNVTWSATNMPLAIIEYEAGPSGPWIPVAQVPGYTGSYAWTVPHDATTTARVRVRDGWDASPEDQSDADFTIGGQTAAVGDGTPTAFAAWQNQPNPFAGRTLIHYSLPRAAHVSLDVFNLQGQRVATLVHENQSAGDYHQSFEARRTDGSLLPAGVYFYRFQAGVFVATKKMLLMR